MTIINFISRAGGGLDETRGTEFPSYLIKSYPINTGLTPSSNSTELWWTS